MVGLLDDGHGLGELVGEVTGDWSKKAGSEWYAKVKKFLTDKIAETQK